MNAPYVSVVLGSNNRLELLKLAIESVRKELLNSDIDYEIIVVDSGSTDGAAEWLAQQIDVLTIIQHNSAKVSSRLGRHRETWGYFMNLGFKASRGKYICMISDDCILIPNAIKNGLEILDRKIQEGYRIGAGAFYWRNWPDESDYHVKLVMDKVMHVNHGLFLNEALTKIGYADEKNYSFYHADVDLVLSLVENGYESIDIPGSYIEHFAHGGELSRAANSINEAKDWQTFKGKWKGRFNYEGNRLIKLSYVDPFQTASQFMRTKDYMVYEKLSPLYRLIKKNKKITLFLVDLRKRVSKILNY